MDLLNRLKKPLAGRGYGLAVRRVELHPRGLAAAGSSPAEVLDLLRRHGFALSLLEGARRRQGVLLRGLPREAEVEGNAMIYARRRE